jgi:glycerophosphoryl diester phosphodiesterase
MILLGHRGAKGEAPENTLAGFAHARAIGVEMFELDVRLSADGQLVVIHDATVDRTTDATGPVAGFTAAELARLDARGTCPTWPKSVGVPTLVEVLDAFADRGRFAIEMKQDEPERLARVAELVVREIDRHGLRQRVVMTSFDPVALEHAARVAPDVDRAYIGKYDAPAYLDEAQRLGCVEADVPLATGSAEIVREAHARGLRVCGWLGNKPEMLRTLVEWQVDAITSDFPSIALRELPRLLR